MNREQYQQELTELLNENKDILDEGLGTLLKAIARGVSGKVKGAGKWLKDAWDGKLEPDSTAEDFAKILKTADPEIQGAIDQVADKLPGEEADVIDAAVDSAADKDDKGESGISIVKGTESEETIPLYKGKKGVGLRSFLDKNLDISGPAKSLILKFVMLQLKSQGYKVNEAKLEEDFTRVLSEKLAKQERPDQARREAEKEVKRDKNKKKSGNLILPAVPEPGSVQGVNLFKGKKGKGLQSLLTRNKQALGLDPQQITQILKKLKPWFKKKGIQVNEAKLQKILMERLHKK